MNNGSRESVSNSADEKLDAERVFDGTADKHARACFIISPIGDDKSPARIRSDQVFKYIIKPVTDRLGYNAIRADQEDVPGSISSRILTHILFDKVVIADLTDHNPNVFYELAIRHAVKKPVIHILHSEASIPFDIKDILAIKYNHENLDVVEDAKSKLEKQIQQIDNDAFEMVSPINSVILDVSSGVVQNPEEKKISEIYRIVSEMANMLQSAQGEVNVASRPVHRKPLYESSAGEALPKFADMKILAEIVSTWPTDAIVRDEDGRLEANLRSLFGPVGVTDDEVELLKFVVGKNDRSWLDMGLTPLEMFRALQEELRAYRSVVGRPDPE